MTPTLTALRDLFSSILCLCADLRCSIREGVGFMSKRDEAMPTCNGKCSTRGECRGEVQQYRVIGPAGADYGTWWYCDEAVDIDRRNGFAVLEMEEEETT